MNNNLLANIVVLILLAAGVAVWVRNAIWFARGRPVLTYQPRAEIQWNPLVLIVAGGWLLLMLVNNLQSQIQRISDPSSTPSQATLQSVQSACLLGFASIAVFLLLLSEAGRRPLAQFGISTHNWRRNCLTGVLGYFAAIPLVLGVLQLIAIFNPKSHHSFLVLLQGHGTPETVFWITLAVVVLAPLSEELIFRVILQGALRSRLSAIESIAISSVLFSLVHGFPGMLALLPLAVVFGYVYERTHSYLAVVVMHAIFNAVMVGLALLT